MLCEWISVNDYLPNIGEEVIACYNNKLIGKVQLNKNKIWVMSNNLRNHNTQPAYPVTHWCRFYTSNKTGAFCKILWVDAIHRPRNNTNYVHVKSVNDAIRTIQTIEADNLLSIGCISIDHDAGDYVHDGGDYIKLLDWLEETSRNYPIHIHSMNPVGIQNIRAIIQRNGWEEIL